MTLNTVEFLFQEAWTSVKRNGIISAAAVTNITAVLLVAGIFLLLAVNVDRWVHVQAAKASITVDLTEDAQAGEVEAKLLADERVKAVKFVSKDENLRRVAARLGWDMEALKYLDNPLPDSIVVETARPEDVPVVADAARKIQGVAEVHYARETALRLLKLVRGIKLVGGGLTLVLAAASLVVVATTIRLTVYARRREIRIMQLVGATHWFVRLPFVVEGALYGASGGILAAVLLLAGYTYIDEQVARTMPFLRLVFGPHILAVIAGAIVGGGVLFGIAGSLIATREYMQEA